ncbi:MAG: hypothetical protein ACRDND_12980, partial [Streptosporangiaceae bacterium]
MFTGLHACHVRVAEEILQTIFCIVFSVRWYATAVSTTPRRVTGDARRWKALSHPLRQEILG